MLEIQVALPDEYINYSLEKGSKSFDNAKDIKIGIMWGT